MKVVSTYRVRLSEKSKALDDTVELYRKAVDFFIGVILEHWDRQFVAEMGNKCVHAAEVLTVRTAKRPEVLHDFSVDFYKFPSYMRRAAIMQAYGAVSSYKTRLALWEAKKEGKGPGLPRAGRSFPALYKDNMFVRNGRYSAQIKVFIRNTWDWIEVKLKKSDVDYIALHCASHKECVPTLRRRGKIWSLDFAFEKEVVLTKKEITQQTIISVDLGINNACVCSAMLADGTVIGRKFLKLPVEKDRLEQSLRQIKNAQRNGAKRMPRLWARAKGINEDISVKTAQFIMKTAAEFNADLIVMEKLDLQGRLRGSKKQRLALWRARYVQNMVEYKSHCVGKRISRVCAWNTSKLAFDGSGKVERDENNYSLCTFTNGKQYHCDLSATYNIGARYFIREIFKSFTEKQRQHIAAKVPECVHRSTCTLSSLIRLNAALFSEMEAKC